MASVTRALENNSWQGVEKRFREGADVFSVTRHIDGKPETYSMTSDKNVYEERERSRGSGSIKAPGS
jgi:hypothetical protein